MARVQGVKLNTFPPQPCSPLYSCHISLLIPSAATRGSLPLSQTNNNQGICDGTDLSGYVLPIPICRFVVVDQLNAISGLETHGHHHTNPFFLLANSHVLYQSFLFQGRYLIELYKSKLLYPVFHPPYKNLLGARTTEVLPTLENIFLQGFWSSGPLHEGIEKFVAARQLTSHSVAVSRWETR